MTRVAWILNKHMDTIDVSKHWDCLHLWETMRDLNMGRYQSPTWNFPDPPDCVVIPGAAHAGEEAECYRAVVDAYGWAGLSIDDDAEQALVIVVSDEASLFRWDEFADPFIGLWISTPKESVHGMIADRVRFFGEGPGPRVTLPPIAKDLDLAFMGQVNHVRRHELAVVCEGFNTDRLLFEDTGGFLQGRPHPDYLAQLARAKVAPCPAGIESVDSFRLYQAIEAGCVPVVERFDRYGNDEGMWGLCYPDGVPFPVVDTWAELPTMMPHLLADHERLSARCQQWWATVQQSYRDWLAADLGLTP